MQCNKPLYIQVKQELENSILSGKLKPGQVIPSVRSLAGTYQINPSTAQRALNFFRDENLIQLNHRHFSVTSNPYLICHAREKQAKRLTQQLCAPLSSLGYSRYDIFISLSQTVQ